MSALKKSMDSSSSTDVNCILSQSTSLPRHEYVFQPETPGPPASHKVKKRLYKMQTAPEEGE